MRALVMQPTIAAEDAAEMLPCLSLSRDPEDRKAFEAARKRLDQRRTEPPRPLATSYVVHLLS